MRIQIPVTNIKRTLNFFNRDHLIFNCKVGVLLGQLIDD